MKFRFCGDLDVPDWLLKEITVLSKLVRLFASLAATNSFCRNIHQISITSYNQAEIKQQDPTRGTAIKIRMLATEILNQLQGGSVDYEKVAKNTQGNFDSSDVKAIVAALHFILHNGAKYDVASEVLETELQQLGLPKENSESISRALQKSKDAVRANFAKKTLSLTKLDSVEWRVDYILSSSSLEDLAAPSVQLNLRLSTTEGKETKATSEAFEVNADKFRVLLHDLKEARALMEGL